MYSQDFAPKLHFENFPSQPACVSAERLYFFIFGNTVADWCRTSGERSVVLIVNPVKPKLDVPRCLNIHVTAASSDKLTKLRQTLWSDSHPVCPNWWPNKSHHSPDLSPLRANSILNIVNESCGLSGPSVVGVGGCLFYHWTWCWVTSVQPRAPVTLFFISS